MENLYEKILVCLDHTSKDKSLIENVRHFGKKAGVKEVIFINVIKDFNLPDQMLKEFPGLFDRAIEDRKEELRKLINTVFESDINIQLLVKQGSITKEILKACSENKVDLVVLGRKDECESVLCTRIARRSTCSILFIPTDAALKLDKIFVPVDFSDYSDLSLETIMSLTNESKAEVFLQNVISVPSSYRYSGKSYKEFGEIIKGHHQKDLNFLIKKFSMGSQKLVPVFTFDNGENIINLIWKEAQQKKVDLIVMGAKGRTAASALFIGSKAERMIRINRTIPLMIIRKKGASAGIFETLIETLD